MSIASLKRRVEKLKSQIQSKSMFLITLKDGKQVTGDFDTAFQYAIAYPSDAQIIQELNGERNGQLPALLNALLQEDEVIEDEKTY